MNATKIFFSVLGAVVLVAPVKAAEGGNWQGKPVPTPTPSPTPAGLSLKSGQPLPAPPLDASTVKPLPTVADPELLALEPEARLERFFEALKVAEVDRAYTALLVGTKIADSPNDVSMLKTKTREAIHLIGKIGAFEQVEVRNVGRNLRSLTYLALGESFPLRWRFYFYRAGEHWKLIDIRISDRLAEMFEERAEQGGTMEDSGAQP